MKQFTVLVFFILFTLLRGYSQPVDSVKKSLPVPETTVISVMSELEKQNSQTNQIFPKLESEAELKTLRLKLETITASLYDLQQDFNNYQDRVNYRKIKSNYIFLNQVNAELNRLRNRISEEVTYNVKVDSMISAFSNSRTHYKSFDMIKHPELRKEYELVINKWNRIDTINKRNSVLLENLQGEFTNDNVIVSDRLREAWSKMEELNDNLWNKDGPGLFNARNANYSRSLFVAIKETLSRSNLLFKYYISNQAGFIVVIIIACLLIAFWINYFIKKQAVDVDDLKGYLHRQPFLSSLLISVSFIPFILKSPPLIFLDLVWALVGIIITLLIISNNDIPGKLKSLWLVSAVVFFLIGSTDVLIYSSLAERWITAVINILCVFIGFYAYQLIKTYSFHNGYTTKILLALFVIFGISSLVYNLLGYSSLSKVLTMTGSYLIFTAIALTLFTQILADLIKMLFKVIHTQASTSFNTEIDSLLREFTILLNIFSFIVWVSIVLDNLNILDGLTASVSLFLNNPIKVGKAAFTPWSIVIFFIIIWVSTLISRIASVLTEYGYNINREAFSSLKNSKLLLKIGIVSFGLILGFAASGIPIDKLAIIISALSVGIGFGLQSLINNLVSGIIISIERPVRIGDSIEVMGFSGIIRDIGIRSSKIHTSNGPDIIIPNGEILSHALIKWTVNNGQRIMDINLMIKYKADLNAVYELIRDVFKNSAGVLKHPEPIINIVSIQAAGINIKCYFWCGESRNWENTKTKVLTDLYYAFKKEGIDLESTNEQK